MLLPVSYPASCTCTKSSWQFRHSLVTVFNVSDLQKLLVQILCPYVIMYVVPKNHSKPEPQSDTIFTQMQDEVFLLKFGA